MADFGDFLRSMFGGSSSEQQSQAQSTSNSQATQSGQSSSTPSDYTPDQYSALRGPLADVFRSILGQTANTPAYSGPLTAGVGGNEQALLSQLMQQPTSSGQAGNYINSVLSGNYLPGGPNGNPFLDAAIKAAQRPTLEGLTETLSRALPGRFTQAGQLIQPNTGGQGGSSAFDRAAGIATRGVSNAVADIATNMSSQGYEAERGRQSEAVGQAQQATQQDIDNTLKNLQAQALPRLIQEQGIERGLALFQQNTQKLLDVLKTIAGVSAPNLATSSQSSSQGQSSSTAQSTSASHGESTQDKGIFPALFPKGI